MSAPANDNRVTVGLIGFLSVQLGLLEGKWRALAAFLFGVSLTLALPPLYILPFIFVSLSGLFWLLSTAPTRRSAFFSGWWFGMGHFTTGLYWITNALLVDAEQFGWLVPFAVVGLSAGFSLYIGLVGLAVRWYARVPSLRNLLFFILIWWLSEWVRGHFLTGFPWNLAGYFWTFSDVTMQVYAVMGVYLAGMLVVMLGLLPVVFSGAYTRRAVTGYSALCLLVVVAVAGGGYLRLNNAEVTYVPDVKLRIVQAGIEQRLKWNPEYRMQAIRTHADLTTSAGYDTITHVIWPESSMPVMFNSGDIWAQRLALLLPPGGVLFTGVVRSEGQPETDNFKIYNSLQALDSDGNVVWAYDKRLLVPFGEYVPLREWLPLDKITPGTLDFSAGDNAQAFDIQGLPPIRPLICYEAIFPRLADDASPAWLLNITNDGWFGDTSGPYQHLAMSRVRAVEQGVPLIRAANTGVSAVIDPYGRITHSLALNTVGVIDAELPKVLPHATLYSRLAKIIAWLPLLFVAFLCRRC